MTASTRKGQAEWGGSGDVEPVVARQWVGQWGLKRAIPHIE